MIRHLFLLTIVTSCLSKTAYSTTEEDIKKLSSVVAIQAAELQALKQAPKAYYYSGALATTQLWEADLIFNKNYAAFCQKIGKTYLKTDELTQHYHIGRGNGYFYQNWYYVGTRYCAGDQHIFGNGAEGNPYNVWKYNGGCGCCIDRGSADSASWTVETSAMIYCK